MILFSCLLHDSSLIPSVCEPGCTVLYQKDRSGGEGRNVGAIYRWRLVGSLVVCVRDTVELDRYIYPELGIVYNYLGPMGLGFWIWIRSRADRIGFPVHDY